MEERPRYTSKTVVDSFPWPQAPTAAQVVAVAEAARNLRAVRRDLRTKHKLSLRDLYRSSEQPGKHPLLDAHAALDAAVTAAYGAPAKGDALTFLLGLNAKCAAREKAGKPVVGPGRPAIKTPKGALDSTDRLQMPGAT